MIALLDSDTLIYGAALASEDTSLGFAKSRLDASVADKLREVGADSQKIFVSGSGNFRYEIDPTYKGNRADKPSLKWREDLRLHLINEWGAIESEGCEADDLCGMHQASDGSTIIAGIDKDLLQIPGKHYQWAIIRKGVVVREASWIEVSPVQGLRSFFTQMLVGDVSDNVHGVQWIGPKKAFALLGSLETEKEMYDTVFDMYVGADDTDEERAADVERFERNLNLLWLWRELGETYTIRRELYGNV